MTRTLACLLVSSLAWVATAAAQDFDRQIRPLPEPAPAPSPEPPPRPVVSPEQVVAPTAGFRMTDRVAFVIDVSGSMKTDGKLEQAVASTLLILQQPVDGFEVAMFAFSGVFFRWEGVPCNHCAFDPRCNEDCLPIGWAAMPRDHEQGLEWLGGLAAAGTTTPAPALTAALRQRVPHLTVVLASDGEFAEGPALEAIRSAQAWRQEEGLPPAAIMVWGAGDDARSQESLRTIAEVGGGGLWVHGERRSGPW